LILLTGAGGKTGRALIKALSIPGSICAFVHTNEQALIAKAQGIKRVVVGDLRDEAAIHSAMQGVSSLYHICPNMHPAEAEIGHLLIRAAREQKVEHFVYHSVLHPQTEKMNHHWQKLRVEEALLESGLAFTILQPAPYMQNLLSGWQSIVEGGILRVPYSVHSRFSFVDLADVAESARIVLTEPGHRFATYELAGTSPMSHVEVIAIINQALNETFTTEQMEIQAWRSRAERGGMSPYAVETLSGMFEHYDRYGLAGNPNVLKWVLKRDPATFESFIRRAAEEHETNH
jgi:NAD(P)H dehydrogenase (quinone)